MERESFEDHKVAKLLNTNFISIKVDREERPDIDHLYMSACIAMNGQGGWPLSIFITPIKEPFFTGTYFPRDSRFGSIGFIELLEHITKAWKTDRDVLINSAGQVLKAIDGQVRIVKLPNDIHDSAAAMLIRSYDPKYGGFGSAPKFPSPYNLMFLMRWAYGKTLENHTWQVISGTLDGIAKGGIRDHIGGGFFRYSTDSKWLVPHFEKMLYDQAMLMMAYTEGTLVFGEKYRRPAMDIAQFVLRDMTAPMGGFYTAFDADSEGEEGKYYLWTTEEIQNVLGDTDGKRFCSIYGIGIMHMEKGSIPNLIGRELSDEDRKFADLCLPKLEQQRRKRIPPFRDEKVLSANNGLMIAALAKAGRALKEPAYIEAARTAADFIKLQLVQRNRLMASWTDGKTAHLATQDAYAYWVWGLLELYEATLEPNWLENAIQWNDEMLRLFGKGTDGLYYTGNDVADLPLRQQNAQDGALPSGISIAAMNMLVLARLTGQMELSGRAEKLIQSVGAEAAQYPHGYTALLTAWLFAKQPGTDVVITEGEGFQIMMDVLNGFYPFTLHIVTGSGYEKIDELAPYTKQMPSQMGKATAYCCTHNTCNPPTTDPGELSRMIQ